MAFRTGSVVVPATSETTDRACPVTALTREDLPVDHRQIEMRRYFAVNAQLFYFFSSFCSENGHAFTGIRQRYI
jgi:hypothetical protein